MPKQSDWPFAPSLPKGQSISIERQGYTAHVEHWDRRVDPYMSSVTTPDGRLIGTGLHPTVAAAKAHCEHYLPKPTPAQEP